MGKFLYFVFKRIKRQVHSTWSGLVGGLAPAKRGHIAAATRPHFGGYVLSGPHCSVVYQPQVAAIETWSPSIQLKIAKSQGDLSRGMRERLKWSRMTDTFDQPRGKPRSLWRRVNAWNVSYPFSSRRSINRGLDREKKKACPWATCTSVLRAWNYFELVQSSVNGQTSHDILRPRLPVAGNLLVPDYRLSSPDELFTFS